MKLKILVVDDNDLIRDVVPAQIAHCGHEGKATETLDQTLAVVKEWKPDAVLLDLLMQTHSGFEVLEAVRRKVEFTPCFVAMTGEGNSDRRQEAAEAGFDFFLRKPFKIAELVAVLDQICDRNNQTK
jgi:CheY-like chemotaxis protein